MANQIPVCGKCNREFRCRTIGLVLEMVASWGSYYKINADLYACSCGNEIYWGFADKRFYNYDPGYVSFKSDVQIAV